MAKKVAVTLVDDLDGSEAVEEVPFGLDGVTYSIDLSAANAAELRAVLTPFVVGARKASVVSKPAAKGGRQKAASAGVTTADVRGWAKDQGIVVPDRGRIKSDVMVKFLAAHE